MTLDIERQVPLASFTTLQVGGRAEYLVRVGTVGELREALRFAKQTAAPPLILGAGSNVLVSDAGYPGLVIVNQLSGRTYELQGDQVKVVCAAGEILDEVIADTVLRGYWGLENLSAIPGTIGATPIQNVGAYGVEVASLITAVEAMHIDTGEVKLFSPEECVFTYRDSFFKTPAGRHWVVTEVSFLLSVVPRPQLSYGALADLEGSSQTLTPAIIREQVIRIRTGKFPDWQRVGTAGSFFKNPIVPNEQYRKLQAQYPDLPGYPVGALETKLSLGWILDHICKLRGYCKNGVCLYEQQALVLVNQAAPSAAAINAFADEVAATVHEKTGVMIEREVRSV